MSHSASHLVDQTVTQYIPDLAKILNLYAEKTVLTTTLRRHEMSNGDPLPRMTWLLVKDYTMNAVINPKQTAPSQWAPGNKPMDVVKVDDVTVEYHFAVPYPMA